MALFHVSLRSNSMGMMTNAYVILPTDTSEIPEGGYPVLYLLHGLSDDHTKWLRSTRIEEYALKYRLCVVMPEAQCSFYCNMANGLPYDDYITKDLPEFIEKTFPVTRDRRFTFIAGLSMGGFGALKSGMREYKKYGACAGLSSAVFLFENADKNHPLARAIMGESIVRNERDDLFAVSEKLASVPEEERTRVYFCVGTSDFLYNDNQRLKAHFDKIGLPYLYEEGEGTHNWDFWDEYIQHALKFFFGF